MLAQETALNLPRFGLGQCAKGSTLMHGSMEFPIFFCIRGAVLVGCFIFVFSPFPTSTDINMSPLLAQPAEQEQKLQCLASAFDALLHAAQFLSRKEQDLQRRVKFAYEEVRYPCMPFYSFFLPLRR